MAGTHDVAAALGQPGRAATSTQEVLTTPHVRRSVYGRESHGAVSEGLLQAKGDDAFAREQPFGLVPHEVPTFPDVRSSAGAGEGLLHDERLLQEQGQGLSSLLVDTTPPRTGLSDPLRPERVPLASQGRGSGEVRISDDLGTFAAPSQGTQKDETSREGYDGSFGIQDPHSLGRGPTSLTGRTVQQQEDGRPALHQGDPWVTAQRGGGEPSSLEGEREGLSHLFELGKGGRRIGAASRFSGDQPSSPRRRSSIPDWKTVFGQQPPQTQSPEAQAYEGQSVHRPTRDDAGDDPKHDSALDS